MRYEIKNKSVVFYLDNPKRAKETVASQSFLGSGLSEQQLIPLFSSLVKKFRGKSLSSQKGMTTAFLRPFFAYFQTTGSSWPATAADWQFTIYRFFQFYLSDANWTQTRTVHRMSQWQTVIGGLLEFLVEDEIIPSAVKIPKIDAKKARSLAKEQLLLGQSRRRLADISKQPQRLLVDISFGMADADYLDSVEKKCRQLVGVIRDTCLAHWNALMQDGETGRHLAGKVTDVQITEAIAAGRFGVLRAGGGRVTRYASPIHPQGHNWALAYVRRNR